MHSAFVLAAGFGTRLQPLTAHRPKPLVPVCGVPMLAYALALCARHGLTDVVVNAHWLADQIRPWEGTREGVRVTVNVESPDILGTGGGLVDVADALADRFAVVNADVLSDVDLGALLDAVPDGGAAMALRGVDADRYGIVAADATGRVVRLREIAHARADGPVDATTHFTGLHAMDRRALALVPAGFSCVVRTAYKALVPERRVAGVRHDGIWLDVGDPAAYLDANLAVLAGDLALPLDPFARAAWARSGGVDRGDPGAVDGVTVRGDAWIGRGARIGRGVVLQDAIVGDGAVVPDGATLIRSVVWDGCAVPEGRHEGAIVYPGGVLAP